MSNSYFKFKHFTIRQDRCAMKVGTDGVLLGAWADVNDAGKILDVGTGTGLIALMLAQKADALIDAIEIDEDSACQGSENIHDSPWNDRIALKHISLQQFAATTNHYYDAIISNPPYFQKSLQPPQKVRAHARHTISLDFPELLMYADKMLVSNGKLYMIIPFETSEYVIAQGSFNNLYPFRISNICSKPSCAPVRQLIAFSRDRLHHPEVQALTIRNADGKTFTDEYRELTKDYYLDF